MGDPISPRKLCLFTVQGMTPLELASSELHHEMALCLLRLGASPSRLLPKEQRGHLAGSFSTHTSAAERTALSSDRRALRDFHRVRFLQALLASTFLTVGNVGQLVNLELLTSDLEKVVLGVLERDLGISCRAKDGGKLTTGEKTTTSSLEKEVDGRGRPSALVQEDVPPEDSDLTSTSEYDNEAVRYVCAAVHQSLTLQHQCRLAVRRMLATSLPAQLPQLGLPQCIKDYVSLGEEGAVCYLLTLWA